MCILLRLADETYCELHIAAINDDSIWMNGR